VSNIPKKNLTFKSYYQAKGSEIVFVEIAMTYLEHQDQEFCSIFIREISQKGLEIGIQKWMDEFRDAKEDLQQEIMASRRNELYYKEVGLKLYQGLEQAKQLSEIRAHFVSMICHQFRTPLNIISFSNSLLKRHINEWTAERIQPLLDHIQVSVEQLSQMLDDILFLTKVEAAKLYFEPSPLNLVKFCDALLAQRQITHQHRQIKFINLGNCLIAWMDEKLLKPILDNLLDNAIKYSHMDSLIELKLTCEQGKVIFQIQDTGIGISLKDQQRLFEPFYRGSNVANIPGTGLGLSIVKTLVDLHGGEITVVSEVGIGTTFTVVLPAVTSTSLDILRT
jgi:signal transduction histidine kinase